MPFIEERRSIQNATDLAGPGPIIDPSFGETVGAALRTQNVVGSYLASRGMPNPSIEEEGFNAIDYVKDDPKYSPYAEEFAGITNRQFADAKKAQIDREIVDRRTLDAAGGMGVVAEIGAGLFDLPTLLPVGGAIGGGRGLGLAIGSAIGAGLDASVSEAGLQATQATRTGAESALNIGGSVVLGGALGALVGRYLNAADARALSQKIEQSEAAYEAADSIFGTGTAKGVGAAAREAGPLVLKDEAIIKNLPGLNIQDPLIRLQLGNSDVGRETVRRLAETPLEYADNAKGVATELGGSTETRIKMWNAPLAESLRAIDTEFARYYHATPEPGAWQRALSPALSEFDRFRGGKKLTYKQFNEEVGRAAYMGGEHEIKEVAAAAAHYRKIDEQLKRAAIDAGLFPEDIKVVGDLSHRFRMYNKEKIIADRNTFRERLVDYLTGAQERISKLESEADKAKLDKMDEFANLSKAEINSLADEVIDQILGNAEGRIPYDIVAGPRGPLKDRLLKIETAKIHEFVENDIETVLRAQTRTMAADVELTKKFGSVDLAEEIRKVNDEINAKIANATTQKERQALEKTRKATIRDIEGIRDRLRGTYALPSNPASLVLRTGRVARNLNYIRLLGGMTISAIPDLGSIIFQHGLTSAFRDGFIPLVTNFKSFRLAADEVKAAGAALDMVLDSRMMALADINDDFGRGSKFERGLSAMSSNFGAVSLMAPWNATTKQITGMIVMNNLLRGVKRVAAGAGDAKDIRRLAGSGIDADMAARIARQFDEHGDDLSGTLVANGADWTDKPALESFRAAVVRDVDRTIVTPGQDKPLWMSTELGKMVGQFKSFGLSAAQKILLSGIQQRDAKTLNGALTMLALGSVVYWAKETVSGRETSDDPKVWAAEAFDRSGLAGWLMEVNNISEKATRGRVGLSALTGEQISRYSSRNVYGAFLGPTADAVSDVFQVSGSIFAGDTTKSDLRKARQLLPYQNLFYIRGLLNEIEGATGSGLGLPDKRK